MEKNKIISAVMRAQSGDKEAIGELYTAFYDSVYYFARKTVGDDDLAMDITQETFFEVIRTIDSLKAPEAFSSWLRQITYHQCTRYFKKSKDALLTEDEEGNTVLDTLTDEDESSIPEKVYESSEFKDTILGMINRLSPEQRAVVVLYYYDELSVKKIAEIQGVSEGTVKSRLNYARKALRDGVEAYEKKTGIKLHGIALVPLFKLFLGVPAQMAPSSAALVGEAVSAAASATATVTAATAATAATATTAAATTAATTSATVASTTVGATIGAKIAAVIVSAAVVIGGGVTAGVLLGGSDDAPRTEITETASGYESIAITEPVIPDNESSDDIYICHKAHVKPTVTIDGNTLTLVNHTWMGNEANVVEDQYVIYVNGMPTYAFVEDTYSMDISDLVSQGSRTTVTVESTCMRDERLGAFEHSEKCENSAFGTAWSIGPYDTCVGGHVTPTLSIEGDTLLITNHSNYGMEWDIRSDSYVIKINGEQLLFDYNYLDISKYIRGIYELDLLPYTSEGKNIIEVECSCTFYDDMEHLTDIGDVKASIEYVRRAKDNEKGVTNVALGDIGICASVHYAPTLSIDGDNLTIKSNDLNMLGAQDTCLYPYIVKINGKVVEGFVYGELLSTPHLNIYDTCTFSLLPYTHVGQNTIEVETQCTSYWDYHHILDKGDTIAKIEYIRTTPEVETSTCNKNHVMPMCYSSADTDLVIGNMTWQGDPSNIVEDEYNVFVDNVLVGTVTVKDTTHFDVSEYLKDGGGIITVEPKCAADAREGKGYHGGGSYFFPSMVICGIRGSCELSHNAAAAYIDGDTLVIDDNTTLARSGEEWIGSCVVSIGDEKWLMLTPENADENGEYRLALDSYTNIGENTILVYNYCSFHSEDYYESLGSPDVSITYVKD